MYKSTQTTSFLFLYDNQGILVDISETISGQHDDLTNIEEYFEQLLK